MFNILFGSKNEIKNKTCADLKESGPYKEWHYWEV